MAVKADTQKIYNEQRRAIRQGEIKRLYVLTGDEMFLKEKIVAALSEELIEPSALSLDRIYSRAGDQRGVMSPEQALAEVRTPPFLSKRKLVILKETNWLAGGRQAAKPDGSRAVKAGDPVAELFSRIPDSACLVLLENKVDRRLRKLIGLIEENGVLLNFENNKPAVLRQWIIAEGKRRSVSIGAAVADSLIDRCDSSMQLIDQELNKIFLYCTATGSAVFSQADLDALSLPDLHGSIFDLTDALSRRASGEALRLADSLISQKQPIPLILFMLTRHFRQLICAHELKDQYKVSEKLKVPPFVATRLIRQAGPFSIDRLIFLHTASVETDIAVKSGRIGERLGLETLLCESAVL